MTVKPIVFFGSSPFSVPVLERLVLSARCQILGVVTTGDKPVGRHLKITPNPVKTFALKNNILVIESLKELNENCKLKIENSVGLVAAHGKLIGPKTLSKLNNQIFGIHPSLLPKYRGPSPLQQQILDGATETGVTIIQLDALMDHGPIVAQADDKITSDDTTVTLGEKLFSLGADLFLQLLNNLPLPFPSLSQREGPEVSYTKKLTRQDGFIPWEEFQPQKLDRKFRAFHPWPGVWTLLPDKRRLKLVALKPKILVQLESNNPQPFNITQPLLSPNSHSEVPTKKPLLSIS